MTGLAEADLNALARLAKGVVEFGDLPSFRLGVIELVGSMVRSDVVAYNEVGSDRDELVAVTEPADVLAIDGFVDGFARYAHQNPLVSYQRRTAARISDFLSLNAFRRLAVYAHAFRLVPINYQAAIGLGADGGLVGITVNRGARDFSDREVALLEAARPFVYAAYTNLRERALLEAVAASLDAAGEQRAILKFGAEGRLVAAHAGGEQLVAELSSDRAARDELTDWIRAQRRCTAPGASLRLVAAGRALEARYLPGDVPIVVLEHDAAQGLAALGLSRRQCEVLAQLREGKTNGGIARSLGLSEHTVRHHLENIYRELGVASRTAALHRAAQLLDGVARGGGRGQPSSVT